MFHGEDTIPMTRNGMRLGVAVLFVMGAAACGDSNGDSKCTPKTCEQASAQCGSIDDGCGKAIHCGTCEEGLGCNLNRCEPTCTPRTCDDAQAECGSPDDGCGKELACGSCPEGETCGADGPFLCGTGTCTPRTCDDAGADCGDLSDGCSKTLDCGECPDGQTCEANVCSGTCIPTTCKAEGRSCGTMDDGCGTTLTCGTCDGATPHCVDGACVACASNNDCSGATPNCVAGQCVACAVDADCGGYECGQWSECVFDGDPACDEGGTQSRTCQTPTCNAGVCEYPDSTETQDCSRITQGNDCGSGCGEWGSCVTGAGCNEDGTESRTCADRTCDAGVCAAVERKETQSCTVDKTGQGCGRTRCFDPELKEYYWVDNECAGGECMSGC